ncbi:TIGR03618 family F420-dependent PPOX class oxidoreductase [Motilibacter rhizosphaerae]|uniref:TIGR03618 family F420-dependent PPOX class oxidoreductase n=1 Tax=Motilibacter rhizosphaerae TaxID=598652 RepID=UPI001E4D941D
MGVVLSDDELAFCTERHLATLTTLRPDGSPHVVPVGFTVRRLDGGTVVRVITSGESRKAVHAAAGGRAAVCQVDRARWLTLEGPARVLDAPEEVAAAEAAYAARYREPRPNPQRVVLEIAVDRRLRSRGL